MSPLGSEIRALRREMGLSRDQLAARAGVDRNTIVGIELGRDARISTVVVVIQALGRSLEITQAADGRRAELRLVASSR